MSNRSQIKFEFKSECLICQEEEVKPELIAKFDCRCHNKYHTTCLIAWWKEAPDKILTCPYCQDSWNYLPLNPNEEPQEFFHREYYENLHRCQAITRIKNRCKRHVKYETNNKYCSFHFARLQFN